MPDRFKNTLLQRNEFVYTFELVPGREALGKAQEDILDFAEKAAEKGIIHALSLTDNPGGHPTLAPDVMGMEIAKTGIDPIVHFTCKDKNRNQIESALHALNRMGINNLLAMTGDFPLEGFEGKAKPVFDLDSVQLLNLMSSMNRGLEFEGRMPGKRIKLPPANIFKGCAVSPFKKLESETMVQYYKLLKKVRAGADFVVTQVGFDARKFDELLRYMRYCDINIPVLGNVYVLNFPAARAMNRKSVPGCVVTDDLCRLCEDESKSSDKGKAARLERAAKQIALLCGIGYNGAHIGGPNLKYEDIEWIIGRSGELVSDWISLVHDFDYPQPEGFYLYSKDSETGLNSKNFSEERSFPDKSPGYAAMRFLHRLLFVQGTAAYRTARTFFRKIDDSLLKGPFNGIEHIIKSISSSCRNCGDCALAETAFLCPQSQCPKSLLNGPCGGSSEGWCEVYPGKRQCIYVRAYDRLKSCNEEASLKEEYVPPRNWALDQTSSWTNYFLGRDHHQAKPCDR